MAPLKPLIPVLAVAMLGSGCLFAGSKKWPTLQIPQNEAKNGQSGTAAASNEPAATPAKPAKSPKEIREGLDSLSARLDLHSNDEHSTLALIADQRSRFETAASAAEAAGPESAGAKDRWNEAQIELTRLAAQVERFSDLATSVRADAGQLAEIYAAIRPADSTGKAGDEPTTRPRSTEAARAEQLTARAGALLDRIRTDRAMAERYVDGAGRRLAAARPNAAITEAPSLPKDREAYIVFHLNRDDTGYEMTIRDAVMKALARKPDMSFDLYTVAGSAADDVKAEDRAEEVKSIIRSMNVAADHVTITNIRETASDTAPEVRVYLR
ncbi:MAG TPA: hypothetical protein VKA19_02605 [Alphaproteobacteria bacterium]|nr:hypothetical protein [Alphaproteobacteria bacterium]